METPSGPSGKYHSYVYIYSCSHDEYLVVHVVDHDALLPRETLKVVSYVAAGIIKEMLPADAPAACVSVIHYLPRHNIIDLTLLDTHGEESSTAADRRTRPPALTRARTAVTKPASSMIEMYYDDVNNLLTETFHYVPRRDTFRRPELDAFLTFINSVVVA